MEEKNPQSPNSQQTLNHQLYIIGTPIGNLSDLSARAGEIIESLDILACEDTRRAGRLCQLSGISRPPKFALLNEHTEERATQKLIAEMKNGKTVGIISDAGMPTISDPGSHLVAAAYEAGIKISVAPGPSAVSCALALSGFDASRFVFEGFLPRKGKRRTERLSYLAGETRTVVIYESPKRIIATLKDFVTLEETSTSTDFLATSSEQQKSVLQNSGEQNLDEQNPTIESGIYVQGNRKVFVAAELTKMHEAVWRGNISEVLVELEKEAAQKNPSGKNSSKNPSSSNTSKNPSSNNTSKNSSKNPKPNLKGEFVIVLEGATN